MTVNKMVRIITGSILCGFIGGEMNLGTELTIFFGLCFGAFIMTFE
jgi:hypothetical protein